MSTPDDRLLYVLSARRALDWSAYKGAFDALHAPPINGAVGDLARARARTARTLDALGHCDTHFDDWSGHVSVAPALLARLPMRGLPEMVLAGARSPTTIARLEAACEACPRHASVRIDGHDRGSPLVPSRVSVQAEAIEDLAAIARSLKIALAEQPPSWALAHFAGSLNVYLGQIQLSSFPEPEWRREDYDPASLSFRETWAARNERDAVRLSRYSDPDRYVQRYLFWRGDHCAPVDRDWGRYALLRSVGAHVLLYDDRRGVMAVPSGAVLPRLLARALTLSSGRAPHVVPIRDMAGSGREPWGHVVYRDVPEQIADLIAEKVGQRATRCPIPDA